MSMEENTISIDEWLHEQDKDKIIDLMYDALGLMQQYNGRSVHYCICKASGFDEFNSNEKVNKCQV